MSTKEKFQEHLIDTVDSMCRCSNTLILLRKQDCSPNFKQDSGSVAEHIALVKVQLDQITEEMGISDDVDWWYTKKKQRLQDG